MVHVVHFLETHTRCVIMNGASIPCFDVLFADLSISHLNTDRTFQNKFSFFAPLKINRDLNPLRSFSANKKKQRKLLVVNGVH